MADPASADSSTVDQRSLHARLEDTFWRRHSNPWSAGTRFAVTPVLMYAIYHRKWRLLAAAVTFTVVNPVLFREPKNTDNWFSEVVLAEEAWLAEGKGTTDLGYPNVLNLLNGGFGALALASAIRRKPVGTVVGTAGIIVFKTWWVEAIRRRTGVSER
ncbi:hypothetical protein AUR64_11285 [Haloprofundus marisrubri]|uniref:Uncharacterized protein n=1 Tax=Haloprofundus marisrubri TaxID=1514971 RepID=A0A0W1RAR3_9EURY|nr:DUF6653 family protein [Haloprofundus marisrubri]KTG10510.1 hypothetical protein AUR64_11285 [Haloprofundus marisrubri]